MKRDLNETWELCIKMWKWIAKVYDGNVSVDMLKEMWIQKHGFKFIRQDCFFCDWVKMTRREFKELENISCNILCPAAIVDPNFKGCCNSTHHYNHNPRAYFQEIKRIYKIRESMKK